MTQRPPFTISGPDWEPGLWWMVLASLGVHLLAIILLLLVPHSFLHQPPALHSYTVDLIAPDRLGGTNMVEGGKGRVEAPPLAAAPPAPKVEPPKPAPPKVEEAKPADPEPPKPEEKPAPAEVAAKPVPPPPPPKPEEPKAQEPPEENEVTLAEKAKKVEPPPAPTIAKSAPTPQAKSPPSPKAMAKAEPKQPPPPSKAEVKAAKAAEEKAAKEAAAAHARDQRIAAAVKRVEQQEGRRGGGTGQKVAEQPGGPISVGPGEGAGGTVKGVEYLLYYNQIITRIKQTWAWAGSNTALEAAVRFNIAEKGEVFNVRIAHSSGDTSYDASVERAVRAANPLPPPPETYRKEFSDVELTFRPPELQQ